MKVPLLFLSAFVAGGLQLLGAPSGPIRILYLGQEGTKSSEHCHHLMRELGREAIWFDYLDQAAFAPAEQVSKFDAVLLDADKSAFPALQNTRTPVLEVSFSGDEKSWVTTDFLQGLRGKIFAAIGPEREKSWQAFLAQREPEKREANPNVANYEKRPQPLTFQTPFSVKGSMERTQVPVGLRLQFFAGEPDITKPIAFAWDERGRLWVAESRDYPHGVKPDGMGDDDIKICEDTDGDGRADKFTVFADHLNLPTSLVFARGGILVSQPPRLLFLKSSKGDDHADIREEVMTGWGIRDTHAQASNLTWGYDNWIHGAVGYSGFKGTVGGKALEFGMGTYRFKSDGSALEFLHQFTNNTWAQSANFAGDDFGGTANGAPIFYGGIPHTILPERMGASTAKKINVEDKAHPITPNFRQVDVMGGYTAACGSAFIDSDRLPPRLQGRAMVCEPTMKVIELMDVQPKGAGYVAKDGFNLVASSDEWMSPVAAQVGPDGAVWFADWQNFIIQHNPTPTVQRAGYDAKTGAGGAHENPLRDHERGRIYRIVADGPAASKKTPAQATDTASLVQGLSDSTQYGRLRAQRLLVENQRREAAPSLQKIVQANDGRVAAIHALWTLQGLGALDPEVIKKALQARDPALRRNAVRALTADAAAENLLIGSGLLSDPDPGTRLAALVKLAELPITAQSQTIVKKLAADPAVKADEWLKEAVRILIKKQKVETYVFGPNLLKNPGFEMTGVEGLPEVWQKSAENEPAGKPAETKIVGVKDLPHGGEHALYLRAPENSTVAFTQEIAVKPHTRYRLSGWIKSHQVRAKVRVEDRTNNAVAAFVLTENAWSETEIIYETGERATATIAISLKGNGDAWFDDFQLTEATDVNTPLVQAGNSKRGDGIFHHHPLAACVFCHMQGGQGSTVGPALDGIASRQSAAYITESLLEPNKVLAKGYENLGVSPMPAMGLILSPQELEDVKAYLQTLK